MHFCLLSLLFGSSRQGSFAVTFSDIFQDILGIIFPRFLLMQVNCIWYSSPICTRLRGPPEETDLCWLSLIGVHTIAGGQSVSEVCIQGFPADFTVPQAQLQLFRSGSSNNSHVKYQFNQILSKLSKCVVIILFEFSITCVVMLN